MYVLYAHPSCVHSTDLALSCSTVSPFVSKKQQQQQQQPYPDMEYSRSAPGMPVNIITTITHMYTEIFLIIDQSSAK